MNDKVFYATAVIIFMIVAYYMGYKQGFDNGVNIGWWRGIKGCSIYEIVKPCSDLIREDL